MLSLESRSGEPYTLVGHLSATLVDVRPGEGDGDDISSIGPDLFPTLCLGHRSWRDLREIRPDTHPSSGKSALFGRSPLSTDGLLGTRAVLIAER